MPRQEPPDWWSRKQRGPTIGCADVTIISITSIAAFVILIMVLIRPDFASVFEQLPGNTSNPAVVALNTTPTAGVTVSARPANNTPATSAPAAATTAAPAAPVAVPAPTATPAPPPVKRVKTVQTCNLRPEPTVNSKSLGQMPVGTTFKLLGQVTENKDARWQAVEQEDNPANKGWMWEVCFDLSKAF